MRDNGFAAAQRAYDRMEPDEVPECPECGEEFDGNVCSCGFDCSDEFEEPNYEDAPEPESWVHGMDA